jgi:hypothetical protein
MQETGRCINLTRQSRRVWANRAALLFCTRKIGWAWQAFVTNAVAVRIIDSQDFHPRPATPLAERSQHLLVPPFRSSPESYSSNAMILFFLRDLSPPAAL